MKPTLTIMTGPQGSGNHLFSKALGQNKHIWVWPDLQTEYWVGHDLEPFAEYWKEPAKLKDFDWSQSNHFVTSISCPYFDDGVESIPQYHDFIRHASDYTDIQVLVIGRDKNITEFQQERVRGRVTTNMFMKQLPNLLQHNVTFASQELLYLYKLPYLQWMEAQLGLSSDELTVSSTILDRILMINSNTKYISQSKATRLDDTIKIVSSRKGKV
ncbi:hypothetical protein N9R43_01355 [bacterium]|nr:hypothetical protein [bacterium]